MNMARKQKCIDDQPMFKFNPETGRHVPLPAQWLVPKAEKTAPSNSKRKFVLTPLKLSDLEGLTSSELKSPNKPAKLRKTDSVRKGLFNVPPPRRCNVERRSISRRTINKTRKVEKKNPCELSPLLDMEEVEEELLHNVFPKGYPFRTPSKPSMKFTEQLKSPLVKRNKLEEKNTSKRNELDKTPESISSNENEYLELERMCGIHESDKGNNQSPISSVCNLLEGTVLGSAKKQPTMDNCSDANIPSIIRRIDDILKENKKALDEYKTSHEENLYKIVEILDIDRAEYKNLINSQETNTKKIEDILNGLKNLPYQDKTENKENQKVQSRRSERLLNKSPIQKGKQKIIISPVILKGGDLRKSTLTKNLVAKSQQYQIHSPRIQKALDMYNSMRGDISILATPKLDRKTLLESPKSSNMSRLLSRRVQNQCLLLQDTPIHK